MRKPFRFSSLALVVCLGLSASFVRAADEDGAARITRHIDRLVALFQPAPSAAQLDALISANARDELFRLESLLRLYRGKFSDLEKHFDVVKEMEDGLGAFEYAKESLKFARDKRASEQALAGLRSKEESARTVAVKLLQQSALNSDLPKLRASVVAHFNGWNASKDLGYVKEELYKMLAKVKDGRLDFNKLEDGIHEFRRQVRWFPLTLDALDGMIVVRDDAPGACPVKSLELLAGTPIAKNKYANPGSHFPAPKPCEVSRCLMWEIARTVRDVGRIKDDAQGDLAVNAALDDIDVASNNHATPAQTREAKAIRDELFSSKTLDKLISQIDSCKG